MPLRFTILQFAQRFLIDAVTFILNLLFDGLDIVQKSTYRPAEVTIILAPKKFVQTRPCLQSLKPVSKLAGRHP